MKKEAALMEKSVFDPRTRLLIPAALCVAVPIGVFGTPYMALATVAYLTMIWALFFTEDRKRHGILMTSAVALDLAIVLTLQFKREAIQTAVSLTLTPLQQAHILFSLLATLLYVPLLILGMRRLKGISGGILHRRMGMTAFLLRTAGFVLMFSMLKKD